MEGVGERGRDGERKVKERRAGGGGRGVLLNGGGRGESDEGE